MIPSVLVSCGYCILIHTVGARTSSEVARGQSATREFASPIVMLPLSGSSLHLSTQPTRAHEHIFDHYSDLQYFDFPHAGLEIVQKYNVLDGPSQLREPRISLFCVPRA